MANGHGGRREGAGNKPKQDFEKTNNIILTAIRKLKGVDTDDEARIAFAMDLYATTRGQIFLAEHLFGKPKENVDITSDGDKLDFNIKDLFSVGGSNK
jgi:hypothetical protein